MTECTHIVKILLQLFKRQRNSIHADNQYWKMCETDAQRILIIRWKNELMQMENERVQIPKITTH